MKRSFIRVLLLSLVLNGVWCAAQGQIRIEEELLPLFAGEDEEAGPDFSSPLREVQSDVGTLASLGFLFYKTFISSQDTPSCVFTPSCSEYAVQAIREKGIIMGWLNTFDRLSRCHGLVGHHHYPFDEEQHRYYDPVQ